jgi:L-alanine-DL-glutamate epimerase-like enolase superfamily enzyme
MKITIKRIKIKRLTSELIMPFTISSGSHNRLENLLLEIKLSNGITGYGEAPIATHITGEDIDKTELNLKKFSEKIYGMDISNYFSIILMAQNFFEHNRAALLSVEMALLDCVSKNMKIPLWKLFGKSVRPLSTDITVVIGSDKQAYEFTGKMRKMGFKIFKIKTGKDEDEDIKRIESVLKAAPDIDIYIDGNCAYSVNSFLSFMKGLEKISALKRLKLIEQPVKKDDFEGLKYLSEKIKIPICADESAYNIEDIYRLIRDSICPAINIKLAKLGIMRSLEIYRIARAKNIKLMIGQMVESQISTFCALSIASAMDGFSFIDLDTPYFLKENIIEFDKRIMSKNGIYDLSYVKLGIGAESRK